MKFLIKTEHLGRFCATENDFLLNEIVVASCFRGMEKDIDRVGRMVQIREKAGVWGTDIYLVRMTNGDLMRFENIAFYKLKPEFVSLYEGLFETSELDPPNMEYLLSGKFPEAGFIVKNAECPNDIEDSFSLTIYS